MATLVQPTFTYTHCKSAAVKKKKKERAVKSVKGLLCSRISSHCDNPRHGASYQLPGVFRGKHSDVKITPHAAHERICKHSSLPFTTDASSFCCSSSHMHCNFPANICHSLLQIQFHRFQTQVSLYKCLSPSCAPFFFSSSVFSSFLGALMPALLFPLSQSRDLSITQFTDAGIFPPLSLAANISSSLILLLSPLLSSTSAKIRAIEAKLQMMEENPDDDYSGPSAYVYNKPPERKRWEPYSKSHHNNQSRPFRKFRR